jgi:hypothetical protein
MHVLFQCQAVAVWPEAAGGCVSLKQHMFRVDASSRKAS